MKYRIDFVTNSSSSSSVIIQVKSKSKVVHAISYDIDILTESLNVVEKSYQSIIDTLVNSEMIGIICNNNLVSQGFVEILGLNDVNLFEDEISKYTKKNQNETVDVLRKLLEFRKVKNQQTETFEEFVKHPYWELIGVNSSKIEKIDEKLTISGDDFFETINTNLDLKDLNIHHEKIDEEHDYFDEDEDNYVEDDHEESYEDDLDSELDQAKIEVAKLSVESSTKKAVKVSKAVNPNKKSTKVNDKQPPINKREGTKSKTQIFTQNERKLIKLINTFNNFNPNDNLGESGLNRLLADFKNKSSANELIDLINQEMPKSIVSSAADALFSSKLMRDGKGHTCISLRGYGDFIELYNRNLLKIDVSSIKLILETDFLFELVDAHEKYLSQKSINNICKVIIDKHNILKDSKFEYSNVVLHNAIKEINKSRIYMYPSRKKMVSKSLFGDFNPYMEEFNKIIDLIEGETELVELPRFYLGSDEKSGCYIATSLYGSYDHPEVMILRKYRDLELKNSYLGRLFIQIYYKISPLLVKQFGELKIFKIVFGYIIKSIINNLKRNGF